MRAPLPGLAPGDIVFHCTPSSPTGPYRERIGVVEDVEPRRVVVHLFGEEGSRTVNRQDVRKAHGI